MGDRICVISDGEVTQIGSPKEIKGHPANQFVADLFSHNHKRKDRD